MNRRKPPTCSTARALLLALLMMVVACPACAQLLTLSGRVTDDATGQPVGYASLLLEESGQWAVSDDDGRFTIKGIAAGRMTLTVQCLGYRKRSLTMTLQRNVTGMTLKLKQEDLRLDEVTITAQSRQGAPTTSYTVSRQALEQQQVISLGDVMALLPGGKTVNPSLMNDQRLSLRSLDQEQGNASFGTAVEVDGVRLGNNAEAGETSGTSVRAIGTSNIESVEVITGIPSVEYGDLSNGIVKVNTRQGRSPFIVEGKTSQHTQQIAVNKGVDLGARLGVLNASVEHARSLSDPASPHTAYRRNILTLNYQNVMLRETTPLTLKAGLTANVGGYSSERDPDNTLRDYAKMRDNLFSAHFSLQWMPGKPLITNLQMKASLTLRDRRQTSYDNASSASAQPYLHTTEQGYHIAQAWDDAFYQSGYVPPIVLGPTGYWYVKSMRDSRPLDFSVQLKADQTRRAGSVLSRLMAGAELTASKNLGRGLYYDSLAVAPTWREYRYSSQPTSTSAALFVEEKVSLPTTRLSSLQLTAGLRGDHTAVGHSHWTSLSPRFNARYVFWQQRRRRTVSDLQLRAGWGKSVKQPSFQVLHPQPSYSDLLSFAPASNADNQAFYAYHTYVSRPEMDARLKGQYTLQTDVSLQLTVMGAKITLSAFHHRTEHPYAAVSSFVPFSYKFTSQTHLQGIAIASADRRYDVDPLTGVVTVSDATGARPSAVLPYNERRTYLTNTIYTNSSHVTRQGVEAVMDFPQIKALRTQPRLDFRYYRYKSVNAMLFADVPSGLNVTQSDGQPYSYIGYYRGTTTASTAYSANATAANGNLTRQADLSGTLTTHIPQLRMVVALRVESTLLRYRRPLSQNPDGSARGLMPETSGDYFGQPYDEKARDKTLLVYPEYYATWDEPERLIPFAKALADAYDNDRALYNDLTRLTVRTSYPYMMNPDRISSYLSANLSVTKEIGSHISVAFYANNFFNSMRRVRSSQTGLETSLFASTYIPSYYYGLSLRLKI